MRHQPSPTTGSAWCGARPATVWCGSRWVHTWTASPQLATADDLPPAPYTRDGHTMADATLRQTVHLSVGGSQLRLRLSNAFGATPLAVSAVRVALPRDGLAGASGVQPGTTQPVTFHGRPGLVVPAGAQAVSDPLPLAVAALTNLTVSIHLAAGLPAGGVTTHPGSRTTSHLAPGDHTGDDELPAATPVEHWYLLSGVEVRAAAGTAALVVLGDSLTDGRGSTTDHNDRWPDRLALRLHADRRTAGVAVLNQATGGNRVLADGLGPGALARLDRDVLALGGLRWLLVFEGVNDIGTADATAAAQRDVADRLIAAYRQIVTRAHARDVLTYGATLPPFGGNGYDDPAGLREWTRQTVNEWIRCGGGFDRVVDFDHAARDPDRPLRLRAEYDCGDHLHLTPAGYLALAEAVPLRLFARGRRQATGRVRVRRRA